MNLRFRSLGMAAALAGLVSACGIWGTVSSEVDCALKPVERTESGLRIGPAKVSATTCSVEVEVDGRVYTVGVGRWLDEDALVLEEYAPITRSNASVAKPVAYALDGVDPREFLVMEATPGARDDVGPLGPYMALWHGSPYPDVCRYADPQHPQYPEECT